MLEARNQQVGTVQCLFFTVCFILGVHMGLTGTWMHDQRHNYYPEFRRQSRYQNQSRVLRNELPTMTTLEEEERQLISKGWARKLACLGYHHFTGSIFSMVLMCSQIVYLMLCTCCPEMLWRTILGDGSQRKDCTRGSSITIYPRCHGQQVHNINSKHSIFLGCGFLSYCKWLIFSSCSCSWCLLLKSLCDLCGCVCH